MRKIYDRILTKDYLIKNYLVALKTTIEIANDIGCSVHTVKTYLKYFGIRKHKTGIKYDRNKKILKLTKEFLEIEYVKNKKSMQEIANMFGISITPISQRIKKFGILSRRRKDYYDDLTGQKFNKLTVIQLANYSRDRKVWICYCDCGRLVNVNADSLKCGRFASCGCNQYKTGSNNLIWKGVGELSLNFWSRIKSGASIRGLIFDITIEDIWKLYLKQNRKCSLSGLDITLPVDTKSFGSHTASLDRIDSNFGYTLDNVQWIHKIINKMKHNMQEKDFIYFCKLIGEYNL